MKRQNVPGVIYLLHFERPYFHARHYLGWTSLPVTQRLDRHQLGHGSRLMAAISEAGIDFTLVRTWEGDRNAERPAPTTQSCGQFHAWYVAKLSYTVSQRRTLYG